MRQELKQPPRISPCDGCSKISSFSFRKGCGNDCQIFMKHLEKVFKKQASPCADKRCGVPGATSLENEPCLGCPLPGIYSKSFGLKVGSCVLGKKEKTAIRYSWPRETEYK